jgi:hypothetical protein
VGITPGSLPEAAAGGADLLDDRVVQEGGSVIAGLVGHVPSIEACVGGYEDAAGVRSWICA